MRRTILEQGTGLLHPTPPQGALALRQAVAAHLRQFRGMDVTPEQIVIGAGTEVLYSLLVQLLGQGSPLRRGRPRLRQDRPHLPQQPRRRVLSVPLDESGLSVSALRDSRADVVHISPSHHYPTGLVMPIARRQQLLSWAREAPGRCILEDDYDSEFRFVGRPIPTLFSIDGGRHVIYLNTFLQDYRPSIRISFMVLPPSLLADFRKSWASTPAPSPPSEQYTLAQFLSGGYYEKHLNRMRKRYHQKRDAVIAAPPHRAAGLPRPHHRGGRGAALPPPAGRRAAGRGSCAAAPSSRASDWPCSPTITATRPTRRPTCWW